MDILEKSIEQIGKELIEIKKIIEELELQFKEGEQELINRKLSKTLYYPELDSKIFLTRGESSLEYNVMEIYIDMLREGIKDLFPKIVKTNKSQIDDISDKNIQNLIHLIFLKNTRVIPGIPLININKMTFKEKKEIEVL